MRKILFFCELGKMNNVDSCESTNTFVNQKKKKTLHKGWYFSLKMAAPIECSLPWK